MRISVDELDQGYGNYQTFKGCIGNVLLDGTVVKGPLTVDTEQGYILKYVYDENNSPILIEDGVLKTEVLTGKVEVEFLQ